MCFACCAVVDGTVPLLCSVGYQRAVLCCTPSQISRNNEIAFVLIFHCDLFVVQIPDEFHGCFPGWTLVPEHHIVVTFIMDAENLHF